MSLENEDEKLIARLKALPPEGVEPDWQKLEAAIRAEVGDRAPVVWWRNWKWIIPVWALATTAAVALIVVQRHHEPRTPQHAVTTPDRRRIEPQPRHVTNAPAIWLDGEALDLDDVDDASLDNLDQAARDAMGSDDVSLEDLDDAALDDLEQWLDKEKS